MGLCRDSFSPEAAAKWLKDRDENQNKSPLVAPDHLKSLELFDKYAKNGRVYEDKFVAYQKEYRNYQRAKYGEVLENDEETDLYIYELSSKLSEPEGISKDDLNIIAKIFKIVRMNVLGGLEIEDL